jgi:hypothetical protein
VQRNLIHAQLPRHGVQDPAPDPDVPIVSLIATEHTERGQSGGDRRRCDLTLERTANAVER